MKEVDQPKPEGKRIDRSELVQAIKEDRLTLGAMTPEQLELETLGANSTQPDPMRGRFLPEAQAGVMIENFNAQVAEAQARRKSSKPAFVADNDEEDVPVRRPSKVQPPKLGDKYWHPDYGVGKFAGVKGKLWLLKANGNTYRCDPKRLTRLVAK